MYCKKRVLIPIDFSDMSLEAVGVTRDLSFSDLETTLLHVYNPIQLLGPTIREIAPPYTVLPKEIETNLLNKLKQIRESKLSDFKEVRLCVEVSRYPAKAICQFAARELMDLIVITTREKTAFSPDLLGSVAEAVVRKAPCAVLVMRKGKYKANYRLENDSYSDKTPRLRLPLYRYHGMSRSECKED
jgi:universal stress protein A